MKEDERAPASESRANETDRGYCLHKGLTYETSDHRRLCTDCGQPPDGPPTVDVKVMMTILSKRCDDRCDIDYADRMPIARELKRRGEHAETIRLLTNIQQSDPEWEDMEPARPANAGINH